MADQISDDPKRFRTLSSRQQQRTRTLDRSYPLDLPVYEDELNRNPRWALIEGSRHFEKESAVFKALNKIAARLKDLGIPYAVVDGMALFVHGLRRFTEDVDILVTRDDLKRIHAELVGLGYLPPFAHSKHLRDTELGVRIEFLTTGEFPGDGKEKPVAFPDPTTTRFEVDGINYINLSSLVELKLASGMTNPGRLEDLSDVLELVKVLGLPPDFADSLNPYVRQKYKELWSEARGRFVTLWRNKWLTSEAKTIDDMIVGLREAADTLEQMRNEGIFLEDDGGVCDDHAHLVTTDPKVAEKYGFVDEFDFWAEDNEADDDDVASDDGTESEATGS